MTQLLDSLMDLWRRQRRGFRRIRWNGVLTRLLDLVGTRRNRILLAVSGGVFVLSLGVFTLAGPDRGVSRSEWRAAVDGRAFRVRCDACRARFDMPAKRYFASLSPATNTIPCPKCGDGRARKVGDALHPRQAEFEAQADATGALAEVEEIMHQAADEARAAHEKLLTARASGDQKAVANLTNQELELRAKSAAFHARWDELARQQSDAGAPPPH